MEVTFDPSTQNFLELLTPRALPFLAFYTWLVVGVAAGAKWVALDRWDRS